jgi:membrane-anchored mycosin MYCP
MARPLRTPAPPSRRREACAAFNLSETSKGQGQGWPGRMRRAVASAGLGLFAVAGAIFATPVAAQADDPELVSANSWVIEQVKAPGAWETTRGKGVTVAVVDTGMGEHPFFDDKDVQRGITVFSGEDDAWFDTEGHGTHVAAGVLYVAPEATILPVRIDNGADTGDFDVGAGESDFESIRWAVHNGANILVMPWGVHDGEGGRNTDKDFLEVIQYAIDMNVVVIVAAGNNPNYQVTEPAWYPGVVAVSGTDRSGNAWYGNTTGPEVVIAAPADEMRHPEPQWRVLGDPVLYEEGIGGTSVASGIVGGVAALTWAAHPELDASNVIQRLIQTADDRGTGGRTEALGFGLVNADQAVHADGIPTVDENPLGYPLGEAGASGASPEDDSGDEEAPPGGTGGEPEAVDNPEAAAEGSSTGLSTPIIIAAAVVLIGAAVAVWLVLRGRGRRQAASAPDGPAGPFNGGASFAEGAYPPPGANQGYGPVQGDPRAPTYQPSPPPPSGQPGFPGPQSYSSPPPPPGGEQSPPWGPGGTGQQPRIR